MNADLGEIEEARGFEVEGRETDWKIRGMTTKFSLAPFLFPIVFWQGFGRLDENVRCTYKASYIEHDYLVPQYVFFQSHNKYVYSSQTLSP